MMQTVDIFMYFYFLIDQKVMNNFDQPKPPTVVVDYCSYTTSHVITNSDMYSLESIGDILMKDIIESEENK